MLGMKTFTTHLVCAPDDLPDGAQIAEWLVHAGQAVQADAPLLRLAGVAQHHAVVHAPLEGVLGEHCVVVGEVISASALIAMIEAEELPTGADWLIPAEDAEAQLSIPACRLGAMPVQPSLSSAPAADVLQLCAALGLAPDEIDAGGHTLTTDAVFRHVRAELRLLAALREMLSSR